MKIVDLKQHETPIKRSKNNRVFETHSFNVEIESNEGIITWQGWSIRKIKKGDSFIRAPMIKENGKFTPIILFKGFNNEVIPVLVRQLLKDQFDIDMPMPTKKETPKNA